MALFHNGWSSQDRVYLKSDEISGVHIDEKSKQSMGKAATGAIVGGILTGGIGLVAGGLLGAKKKNASNLYISFKYKERELEVILNTGKKTTEIYNEIITQFA